MTEVGYPKIHAKQLISGAWDVFCRGCGTQAWLGYSAAKLRFENKHAKCREGRR